VRHNPPAYYTALTDLRRVRDVSQPVSARTRFTFVTPNMCHDMHDCDVSEGDRWLASALPLLTATGGYRRGGMAVLITWDEDDGGASNHVPTLVVSPYTRRGVRSAVPFDHFSLLRTTEEMLGLPCLGSACAARSMRSAFGLCPQWRQRPVAWIQEPFTFREARSDRCGIVARSRASQVRRGCSGSSRRFKPL
jgi:hypothetical protein